MAAFKSVYLKKTVLPLFCAYYWFHKKSGLKKRREITDELVYYILQMIKLKLKYIL